MRTAIIIVDTGYSMETLSGAEKVLATIDLQGTLINKGKPYKDAEELVKVNLTDLGSPYLDAAQLSRFAGDPAGHGSMVLKEVRKLAPDAPLVLVRFGEKVMRTQWNDGKIAWPGWTEGYRRALDICRQQGLPSVANLSFGGYPHGSKGGWEAYQLSFGNVPGHAVLAAAGAGDGAAEHASGLVRRGNSVWFEAFQKEPTRYNLWVEGSKYWSLSVNGPEWNLTQPGVDLLPNFWNGLQQLTFEVPHAGLVNFELRLPLNGDADAVRFDCWVQAGDAAFHNHVDPHLVVEPAVFPDVIAVGLKDGQYSPEQEQSGCKPDLLLNGPGPISKRIVAATVEAALILDEKPVLDKQGLLRELLLKHAGKVW